MNDLQKLHAAIGSLEEQASQVHEFNGVLRAVSDARAEIEASNVALSSLSIEQKQLVKDNYNKFDVIEKRLSDLEMKLSDLAKGQDRVQRTINELKILSPDQFEHGRDKVLLKLAELNFLTPVQYQDGLRSTKESLNFLVAGLRATKESLKLSVTEINQKIEQSNQANQASLSALRTVTVLGMLTLACGIAYLAYSLLQ